MKRRAFIAGAAGLLCAPAAWSGQRPRQRKRGRSNRLGGGAGESFAPSNADALDPGQYAQGGANSSLGGGNLSGGFSVAFWVRDPTSGNSGLLGKTSSGGWADGWGFDVWTRNPTFWIGNWNTSDSSRAHATSSVALTADTWQHVAGRFDASGNLTIWIDGVQRGSAGPISWGSVLHADAANLQVGRLLGTAGSVRIDELGIWDTPLSSGQISSLAGGTPTESVAGASLVSRWTFDDDGGTPDGTDQVGSNDLTIV